MAEIEQTEGAPAGAPGRSGRVLAIWALLLSLGAAALTGWLAWQAPKAGAFAALRTELAAWQQRQLAERQALQAEFEALASSTERQLATLRQSHARQSDLIAQAAQSQRDEADPERWRLTEAEYLMRVANHRLLMERDAEAAENLLALADGILVEVGGLAYHDVRTLLAHEMTMLRTVEDADAQGVFLRLEALKALLDRLPLRLPTYAAPRQRHTASPPDANGSSTLWEALVARLSGLVRFRRHDGEPVRPLLPPRQAEYLQLHLRLALDRAQLAALRHDQAIYRASLAAAQDWLRRFVDPARPATEQLMGELGALLDIDFDRQLPDISQSLSLLRALRAETSAPGDGAP